MSLKKSPTSPKFPPKEIFFPPEPNSTDSMSKISFLTQKIQTLEERLIAKTRENESLLLMSKNPTSSGKLNETEIFTLKTKISDLEQNNLLLARENDYYRRNTTNKDNIELKTTKIVELEQNCTKLIAENAKLNELCKAYMKENDDLKSKRSISSGYDSLRLNVYNEISEMGQKLADMEKKTKELKADNEFLAYKIKEKELDNKNMIETLENSNLKLINDNRILISEKEKLIEEIKILKEKNSTISLEHHDLETKLINTKKELESEKIRSLGIEQKYQKNLESLEENSEKKIEISRIIGEIDKKNARIHELEDLLDKNIKETNDFKGMIAVLREKVIDLQKTEKNKEKIMEKNKENSDLQIEIFKNENDEDFRNISEKLIKLKEKNKLLRNHLKEKMEIIETLKIYQEKYEGLLEETKNGDKNMETIVILSAENDRLRNLIHEYVNKDFESKNNSQHNKNLKEYNNLCILVKDLEKRNFHLIEENNALKLVNDQKIKEINRIMIENSQLKKQNWDVDRKYQSQERFYQTYPPNDVERFYQTNPPNEVERFYQTNPPIYHDTPRQEHKKHPQTNFFHYY